MDREADAVTWDGPAFRAGSGGSAGLGLTREDAVRHPQGTWAPARPQCPSLAFKGVNSYLTWERIWKVL